MHTHTYARYLLQLFVLSLSILVIISYFSPGGTRKCSSLIGLISMSKYPLCPAVPQLIVLGFGINNIVSLNCVALPLLICYWHFYFLSFFFFSFISFRGLLVLVFFGLLYFSPYCFIFSKICLPCVLGEGSFLPLLTLLWSFKCLVSIPGISHSAALVTISIPG